MFFFPVRLSSVHYLQDQWLISPLCSFNKTQDAFDTVVVVGWKEAAAGCRHSHKFAPTRMGVFWVVMRRKDVGNRKSEYRHNFSNHMCRAIKFKIIHIGIMFRRSTRAFPFFGHTSTRIVMQQSSSLVLGQSAIMLSSSSSSNHSRPCVNPYQNVRRGNPSESSSPLASILDSLMAATEGATTHNKYTRQQWMQLQKALKEHIGQWKFSQAMTLLEWVSKQVQQRENEEHAVRSLNLLAMLLNEHWGIHLVYAISCPTEDKEKSPFLCLSQWSRDTSRPTVQGAACVCLAALWRALSQLDVLTSPSNAVSTLSGTEDNAWWIKSLEKDNHEHPVDGYWNEVFDWCLEQWLRSDADNDMDDDDTAESEQDVIEQETLKHAASVLLVQFLHDETSSTWLYSMPESNWSTLTERLIEQSQRLVDPNMPMTSFARLSLVSLHLLALMDQKAGRDMPHSYEKLLSGNGGLVVAIMQSTLQVTSENVPRWAADATIWAVPILREWSKAGTLMSYWEMETRSELARAFAKDMFERIGNGSLVKPTKLASFLWLLRETPALCRNVLMDVVPKEQWFSFVESLVALVLRDKTCAAIASAAVLHQILSLSPYRKLEQASSQSSQGFLDKIVSRATVALELREEKALLLLLLDSLKFLSESTRSSTSSSLFKFVENLLPFLSHTVHQVNQNMTRVDSDSSMDSEDCTPPAGNLSRIDVSIIMPDHSQEVVVKPIIHGLEPYLRISAATLVAIVTSSTTNKDRRAYHSQALQVLSNYTASEDMISSSHNSCLVSKGAVIRKAALLRTLATMQEESYFVDAYVNMEVCRARELYHSSSEAASLRKRIEWLEIREKQLSKENNALEARLSAHTITAQRERNVLHRKLVSEAKQTLKAEITQRAALQSEVDNLREITKQVGEQLQVAETQNKNLQENETVLKTELSEKAERLQRLESEISQVTQERDNECERATKLSKEVESSNESINKYKKREKQLRDQIEQHEVDLEGLEASRAEMHANLENLFGDMVSLANAYELKEKEVSSGHKNKESTIEKLEMDLDKERQRRKDLEDKYRQGQRETRGRKEAAESSSGITSKFKTRRHFEILHPATPIINISLDQSTSWERKFVKIESRKQ
eukprot:scaffold1353_cov161-Amphora_coffeaeformis.AAC.34